MVSSLVLGFVSSLDPSLDLAWTFSFPVCGFKSLIQFTLLIWTFVLFHIRGFKSAPLVFSVVFVLALVLFSSFLSVVSSLFLDFLSILYHLLEKCL